MLKRIGFWCFSGVAWLLALLPLRCLHVLAALVAVVMHRLWGYRRSVVMQNLRNSFPEKTESELKHIAKNYYHHLAVLLVEVLKMPRLKPAFFQNNISIDGTELLQQNTHRHVLLLCGHTGNWEWAGLRLGQLWQGSFQVAYKPLSHPRFNQWYKTIRQQTGNQAIPMQHLARHLLAGHSPAATCLLADQTPASTDNLWLTFLHQETLFFGGVEKLAAKLDAVVLFAGMHRTSPGQYHIQLKLLTPHAASLPQGRLMQTYATHLEEAIHTHPYNWLWSHRRWKHKKRAD